MRRNNQQGFTMAELFVVITIIGVLAAIAVPVFGNVMPGIRLREGAQEVYRIMQLAKMEAVKRNKKVFIEFPKNSGNCASGKAQPTADIEYFIYFLDPVSHTWIKDPPDPKDSTTITKGFLPPGVALCSESTLTDGAGAVMAAFKSDGLPGKPYPQKADPKDPDPSVKLGNSKGRIVAVELARNGGIRINATKK